MGQHKKDTIGSHKADGLTVSFEIILERDGEVIKQRKNMDLKGVKQRWKCSCESRGMLRPMSWPKRWLLDDWKKHAKKRHPDYTV